MYVSNYELVTQNLLFGQCWFYQILQVLVSSPIELSVVARNATGHANKDGLQMSSFRIPGGLQASLSIPAQYSAFPGIINGGIVATLFDCHGVRPA